MSASLSRVFREPQPSVLFSMISPARFRVPRLSIILPVQGNPTQMEDALVSVLENRPADCEILVVLNEPYDDPYHLQDEVCFIEAPRQSRLVDIINLGIAVSRAPLVHLLACGVEVGAAWAEQALGHFADPTVAAVVPWVRDRREPQQVVSAGAAYDRCGRVRKLAAASEDDAPAQLDAVVDPDLPVAFYRKSALDRVGRFSRKTGERLSCVDAAIAMEHAGFRCVVEPHCATYAAETPRRRESAFSRGWAAERLFWRWAPHKGWLASLPLHLWMVVRQCAAGLPRLATFMELLGRILGAMQVREHCSHWQSLRNRRRDDPASPLTQGPHSASRPAMVESSYGTQSDSLVAPPRTHEGVGPAYAPSRCPGSNASRTHQRGGVI